MILGVYLIDDTMNLMIFSEFSVWGQRLIVFSVSVTCTMLFACVFYWKKQEVWKRETIILLPLLTTQIKIYFLCYWITFDKEFYPKEGGSLAVENLVESYHASVAVLMAFFCQHSQLVLEIMKEGRGKKSFMGLLVVELTLIVARTQLGMDFSRDEHGTLFRGTIFMIVTIAIIAGMNMQVLTDLQRLSKEIIDLELEENLKYKRMFNALEDSILLVKTSAIKFSNKLAQSLFKRVDEAHQALPDFDKPIFHLFNDTEKGAGRALENASCRCFSMRQLLSYNIEVVNNSVFTNSKLISESTQMDQVQKIIQEQHDSSDSPLSDSVKFFQIKLIRVNAEKSIRSRTRGPIKEDEEVMVQIQDISLRVQSQYMRIER